MKNLVLVTACKGSCLKFYLKTCPDVNNTCQINIINVLSHDGGNKQNNTSLDQSEMDMVINADILIYMCESKKEYLKKDYIYSLCKESCTKIYIGTYTSEIYTCSQIDGLSHYDYHRNQYIEQIKNMNFETIYNFYEEKIKTCDETIYDNVNNKVIKCIEAIRKIDNISDVKMEKFFIDNYKSHRLFVHSYYPSGYFFYGVTCQILKLLNFSPIEHIPHNFAENKMTYISKKYYEAFEFTFENSLYGYKHTPITCFEWYMIMTFSPDLNFSNSEYVNDILLCVRNKDISKYLS